MHHAGPAFANRVKSNTAQNFLGNRVTNVCGYNYISVAKTIPAVKRLKNLYF